MSYNVKYFKETEFAESSSENRGVFRTQASIYNGAFLWIDLTAYFVCNKSSILDVLLDYV